MKIIPSLLHSLTPSLPHPLTPSPPHPLTPSPPHPLTPSRENPTFKNIDSFCLLNDKPLQSLAQLDEKMPLQKNLLLHDCEFVDNSN